MPVSNTMQSLSLSLGENGAVKQRTWNANHPVGHDVSHACPILDIGLLPGIGNVDIQQYHMHRGGLFPVYACHSKVRCRQ
jgi:hypothetical protein